MAFVIQAGDTDVAIEDVRPLGFLVPVQFPNDTSAKPHVHARELYARSHLADSRLTGPTALLSSS
jgi:hypothetical protein